MKYRLVSTALSGACVLLLAACSPNAGEADTGPSETASAQTAPVSAPDTPADQASGQTATDSEASAAFASLIEDFEAWQAEESLQRRAQAGDVEAMSQWPDISRDALNEATQAEIEALGYGGEGPDDDKAGSSDDPAAGEDP